MTTLSITSIIVSGYHRLLCKLYIHEHGPMYIHVHIHVILSKQVLSHVCTCIYCKPPKVDIPLKLMIITLIGKSLTFKSSLADAQYNGSACILGIERCLHQWLASHDSTHWFLPQGDPGINTDAMDK